MLPIESIKHWQQNSVHKLLFDNNISHRVLPKIVDIFPNSLHVMLKNLDESTDLEVWKYAKLNGLAIIFSTLNILDLLVWMIKRLEKQGRKVTGSHENYRDKKSQLEK